MAVRCLSKSNGDRRLRRNLSSILRSGTPYIFLIKVLIGFSFLATVGALTIVTRSEWKAIPAKNTLDHLRHPAPYVIILHTASKSCSNENECKRYVQNIQDSHMRYNGWSDIGYSFLIGGDGNVYEGRGWDSVGAFARGYNFQAIGIAFIGNFNKNLPSPEAIAVAKELIAEGVRLDKISKDYKLLGHRQLDSLKHPVSYVIILHTVTESCKCENECKKIVKSIQHYHIKERGWFDIGYSFLVCGDGNIYYGRGWDSVGAFAKGYNSKAIGIAFIGNFNEILPTPEAIDAVKELIAEGVKLGKISKDYKLLGHKQGRVGSTTPTATIGPSETPGALRDHSAHSYRQLHHSSKMHLFVRKTQTFHIQSFGWWDISYSFLVGGDGFVYEGRGWDGLGAFAYGYNNRSIGISFIGTFIKVLPPPQQIQAAKQLIVEGVRLGKISPNYKLLAHRQVSATESPGEAFYENIKTWDHWAESP
ncbi:hypothetical protein C0J52_15019 [Blattella germanica]|nr:hypothetical protein C0J52_15019 [Blattella germanica]